MVLTSLLCFLSLLQCKLIQACEGYFVAGPRQSCDGLAFHSGCAPTLCPMPLGVGPHYNGSMSVIAQLCLVPTQQSNNLQTHPAMNVFPCLGGSVSRDDDGMDGIRGDWWGWQH